MYVIDYSQKTEKKRLLVQITVVQTEKQNYTKQQNKK